MDAFTGGNFMGARLTEIAGRLPSLSPSGCDDDRAVNNGGSKFRTFVLASFVPQARYVCLSEASVGA